MSVGTRALVHIKNGGLRNKTIVTLYRQMDGYESGLGQEIVDTLNAGDCRLVNGYRSTDMVPAVFNGMQCLAAYLVGRLKVFPYGEDTKNAIGSVYLMPANTKDVGEEYVYTIYTSNDVNVCIKVTNGRRTLFNDTIEAYNRTLQSEMKSTG